MSFMSNLYKNDCLNKVGRAKVQKFFPVQKKNHNDKM